MPKDASTRSIPEKLQLRTGRIVLFVNKPAGYDSLLGQLPHGVGVTDESARIIDVIQVFVETDAQLRKELPRLKPLLASRGIIWVTYPKGTSGKSADLNRDTIAAYAETIGMEAVAIVSIDDTWSALRLKLIS
jgi:hypothetical protein